MRIRAPGRRGSAAWFLLVILVAVAGCRPGPSQSPANVPLFEIVTAGRIAHDGGATRGVAWVDFDDDGDPDLVTTNTSNQWNAFYLNTLDWRNEGADGPARRDDHDLFLKVTDPGQSSLAAVGAAGGRAEGAAWVDYDGDGDLDLHIVTRGQAPDLLFANRGSGELVRVTEGPLVRRGGSSMACWADVDGDGWLDVFLAAYRDDQRNSLLRNRGDGRFDVIVDSPVAEGNGSARACAWGDADDDGLPDLYVGNALERNAFYRNRGSFLFERDGNAGHAVDHVAYTYGLSWADFDGDGWQDLFVANFDTSNALYRNDGSGRLVLVEDDPIVVELGGASKGHAWGDYDLDGDLDLFVANGTYGPDMRNFLYLNDGNGRFVREARGAFAHHADTSAGAAWADYDLDGDLDIYVANWGSSDQVNRLYRNTTSETTSRGWVAFRLRSDSRNTHGWGAKVRAKASIGGGDRWMTRWHVPTTGYGSQNDLVIHFGMADAPAVDSLVVTWPSGAVDTHVGVAAGRVWVVREGGDVGPYVPSSGR